jgi:hypothetical protein
MLWTSVSALAAGVAIGTAGSVIALKQGTEQRSNAELVRPASVARASVLAKDDARLPAGVQAAAPATGLLVEETTLFAFPPQREPEPNVVAAVVPPAEEKVVAVPAPIPQPVAKAVRPNIKPRAAKTVRYARPIAPPKAAKPQEQSWLERLRQNMMPNTTQKNIAAVKNQRRI